MTVDLLLFRVGRELFATELRAVEEAVALTSVQQIPGTAAPVRGVLTLRGALVPLFSAAAALGLSPGEAATALVVRDAAGRIAIAVDDVEDVLSVRDGERRPVPAADARDAAVLRGVVRRGNDLIALVDLDALIAACRGTSQPEAA
ncbi:MAG: chemotaxis protein CheW [Gemmatimonadaceae bacterium]